MPPFERKKSDVCCEDCFTDPELRKHLRKVGRTDTCGYCQKKSKHCADERDVKAYFSTLAGLYERVDGRDGIGDSLVERIQADWSIFSSDDTRVWEDIFDGSFACKPGDMPEFESGELVIDPSEFYEDEAERNSELKSAWEEFSWEIKHSNRFLFSKSIEWLDKLLDGVSTTVGQTKKTFYRARKVEGREVFSVGKIGAPPAKLATAGRGNPEGIAYLYLAESEETATAETRPPQGQRIWVARFDAIRTLKVIDLRTGFIKSPFRYPKADLPKMISKLFLLRHLATELSKPINRSNARLEYLPTQYLCELIKSRGYDGIRYGSSVGDKSNLLVFEPKNFRYKSHKDKKWAGGKSL